MAKKTLVEKAAEKVGYGLAMAEDVAGAVRNIGWCCRDHGFQCANACKEGTKKVARRAVAKSAAKKAPARKAVKKTAAKSSPATKTAARKAAKKSVKAPAKKTVRTRR
jgi:hypothetical protein